jgi:site-specific DNA-methyltransferase (adenine-specific)
MKQEIWHGDCLELMKDIPDGSVDLICADLPYGSTKCKWDIIIPFEPLWKEYNRIMKTDTAIVLFGTEPFASHLRLSNLKMFKYDWVWEKSKSGSAFTAKYRPVNKHEMICVFGKGKTKYNPQLTEGEAYSRVHDISECDTNNHGIGFNKRKVETHNSGFRYPITVQKFQQKWRRQDQLHPTQKPVGLLEYLIKTYSDEGNIVLDNCAGSGTTGVAAKNLNRQFILIEKEKEYYDICVDRLKNI